MKCGIKKWQSYYLYKIEYSCGKTAFISHIPLLKMDRIKIMRNNFEKDFSPKDHVPSIIISVITRNDQMAKFICSHTAFAHDIDYNYRNAVHHAAINGNVSILPILIKTKININLRDRDYLTPLMTSIKFNKENVFDFLLENGADLFLINGDGDDALQYASYSENNYYIKKLSKYNFDKNYCGVDNRLIKSIKNDNFISVKNLSDIGSEIIYDSDCLVDLTLENLHMFVHLVSVGINPHKIYNNNITLLLFICKNEKYINTTRLITRLINNYSYDLNVNWHDDDGNSAMSTAILSGNLELVRLLLRIGAFCFHTEMSDIESKINNNSQKLCYNYVVNFYMEYLYMEDKDFYEHNTERFE